MTSGVSDKGFYVFASITRFDEWIVVGAHLDSWDHGPGAQDNGTGCAMVLEAARAIAALGQAPRRSIRFALWGGEEQGLIGSLAYVQAHSAEIGKCVAALNTNTGAGHPRGWKVGGRNDVSEAVAAFSPLLTGLGAEGISPRITIFRVETVRRSNDQRFVNKHLR